MGVRQTRLLEGEYVVTKDDVTSRHFADSVARGRDYYTPYRALLPKNVDQLLVAGRHYSATPDAQRISREIPPCMAQGQAAGIAAGIAVAKGIGVRDVDPVDIQRDAGPGRRPGDVPSDNATIDAPRRSRRDRTPADPAAQRRHRHRLHPGLHGPELHPAAR